VLVPVLKYVLFNQIGKKIAAMIAPVSLDVEALLHEIFWSFQQARFESVPLHSVNFNRHCVIINPSIGIPD
jgi:hypothetical protein